MNLILKARFALSTENPVTNMRASSRARAGGVFGERKVGVCTRLALAIFFLAGTLNTVAAPKAALTGVVSSEAEGKMEGVLVSAKRTGGKVTITVVTDKNGAYIFPEDRLEPGDYKLTIRAVGYIPETSSLTASVGKGHGRADIKLKKTQNLVPQLSNAEWLMSIPGTQAQKEWLSRSCVFCHNLTHIMTSSYDAAGWMTTFARMANYSGSSTFTKPIPSPTANHEMVSFTKGDEELAAFLASVNLSHGPYKYELKTLPRPRGDDTKVVITEYDLPRTDAEPHDAVSDGRGMVWYCDFSEGIVGRLDPSTAEVKEWEGPSTKPGFPGGLQMLELDSQGNSWVTRHEYNGFTKFDKAAEKFTDYSLPTDQVSPRTRTTFLTIRRDDKIWVKDNADRKIFLFDPKTGSFTGYKQFSEEIGKAPLHNIYGVRADSIGNEYGADIDGGGIAKVDAETGKATFYPTPTPDAGPRRMHMDSEDRLWIGDYYVNKIARFDTRTAQFQEWAHPIAWFDPYDVALAKDGGVWTGGMNSDLITRLNPKTGEFRNYLMPRVDTNVRRVDVDNSGAKPVFWVGENHQGKIAKVEPLE
jgi:virginiamycin B lyase